MFNQQFFSSTCEIVGAWNLDERFRVKAKISRFFGDPVCMIGMFVENLLVALHFFLKPWNINANQRVELVGRCFF